MSRVEIKDGLSQENIIFLNYISIRNCGQLKDTLKIHDKDG
jgi:hypothetical protein